MKGRKGIIAILLAVMMVFTYIPTMVFAADDDIASGDCDGVPYRITADGTLIIGEDGGEFYFKDTEYRKYNDFWYNNRLDIKNVVVKGTVHGQGSMSGMFYDCKFINNADLSGLETSGVTKMDQMFSGCNYLKSVDISGWDTGNVTNMSRMFFDCRTLSNLDLSGFNTSKVTTMDSMF